MLSNYSFEKKNQEILLHQQLFKTHHQEHKQAHLLRFYVSAHQKTTQFLQLVQLDWKPELWKCNPGTRLFQRSWSFF